jgi:hypothetical protein
MIVLEVKREKIDGHPHPTLSLGKGEGFWRGWPLYKWLFSALGWLKFIKRKMLVIFYFPGCRLAVSPMIGDPVVFLLHDAAQDGQGSGVGRIYAEIRERHGAEVLPFGQRGVRGIMEDP